MSGFSNSRRTRERAAHLVQSRVDVGDLALVHLALFVRELHLRRLADLHPGRVELVDLGRDPDVPQVADPVEILAGHHARALHHVLVQHEARAGRADGKGPADLSGFGDRCDLFRCDVPQVELAPGRAGQLALGPLGSKRQQVFLLRRDEIGGVDLEQRLALLDRVARLVDVDPLHPAGEAEVHDRDLVFAHLDLTDAAHVPKHGLPASRLDPHSHVLHHGGIDRDCARSRRARRLVLVDRNQIHPHRGLSGLVRDVGRVHRRHPVLDLPLAGAALGPRRRLRGAGGANRREIHAADRAGPRPFLDHVRVHPAGVELHALGRARRLRGRGGALLPAGDQQEASCDEDGDESHHGRPPRCATPMVASAAAAWMWVCAAAESSVRSRSSRVTSASKSVAKSARPTV